MRSPLRSTTDFACFRSSPRHTSPLSKAKLSADNLEQRVLAVVVTFDAPNLLRRCIDALLKQSRPLEVLVIDNHSRSAREVRSAAAGAEIVRLPENTGPAGGFFAGMSLFLERNFTHVWLFDDDVAPRPDCLEKLLATTGGAEVVVAPRLVDERGEVRETWGWIGLLVPREVVVEAGLPLPKLFWGSEDAEWLHYRVRERHGYELRRASDAWADVVLGRPTKAKPDWKYYYEFRNSVYTILYRRRHLPLVQRLKILAFKLTRQIKSWTNDEGARGKALAAICRGVLHGLLGRTGKTALPESGDRPQAGTSEP